MDKIDYEVVILIIFSGIVGLILFGFTIRTEPLTFETIAICVIVATASGIAFFIAGSGYSTLQNLHGDNIKGS